MTLQSIGDGVIATDAEGKVTLLNPVAEALTGWTSAEAAGQPLIEIFRIINEVTGQAAEDPVAQVLRGGVAVGLANHTVLISTTGAKHPIDDCAAPIRDDRGRLVGVVLIFRDVSEQRASDRRRAARLAVTQTLAEVNSIDEAAHGILRALCENLGWRVGGFWLVDPVNQDMRCLDAWFSASTPDEGFRSGWRSHRFKHGVGLPGRVWASAEPVWIADISKENNFLRTTLAGEAGLHAGFAFPILAGGHVLGLIELFREDVSAPDPDLTEMVSSIGALIGQFMEHKSAEQRLWTERKRQEQALQASEQRWRTMAEALPNLVWTDLPDGQCDWLSSQWRQYTGIPEHELLGMGWLEKVVHPDDREPTLACWTAACADQANYDVEYRIRRHDGEYHWFKTRGVPLRDSRGQIVYWFGTCTDIQDVKQLEAALREADQRKNEFLATLAHELRNPLAPLRTGLHVLGHTNDRETHKQTLQMMRRQLAQMVRLIDDLMDISRISRNKLELRKAPIALASVLENAVETARPLIDARGHSLTVSMPAEPVILDADLTRLAQVFWNLLINSAKYTDPGGQIELYAEGNGTEVVVTVKDNGIGIPPHALPGLFTLFSQVEGASSGLRVAWVSAWHWSRAWWKCTAEKSRAIAAGWGEAANSSFAFPCLTRRASVSKCNPRRSPRISGPGGS